MKRCFIFRKEDYIRLIIWIIIAIIITVLIYFPIFWLISVATRTNIEVLRYPPKLIQSRITFEAFKIILSQTDVYLSFFNTVYIASGTTLFCLLIASFGAYGMSRYSFRGKDMMQFYMLLTQMLPTVLLAIPYFSIFNKLSLYDTKAGLILAYTSFSLPFCTLTLLGFFNSIPRSLDEAAKIDGCGELNAFFRIIFPVARAGLVSTGLFAFITAWNEYLMAQVLSASNRSKMLVVVIGSKIGQYDISWNQLAAITVLASAPLILFYALNQRAFSKGITAGAIKM